jgi:hypothetical protein
MDGALEEAAQQAHDGQLSSLETEIDIINQDRKEQVMGTSTTVDAQDGADLLRPG